MPAGTRRSLRRRRSILWRWRKALFVGGLCLVASASLGLWWLWETTPLPPERPVVLTTFICPGDVVEGCNRNNALGALTVGEDRVWVPLDRIPKVLKDAVVAAEDRDFFEHEGVDLGATMRALLTDLRARRAEQGGSTITQQYVKTVFLDPEKTLARKLREIVLATKLEQKLSKEEILERYLNTVYFGRGAYGVQAASRAWFSKDVWDIGLPEAAYLAGLIRSPETADAWRDEEDRTSRRARDELAEAKRRRRSVLDAMVEEGYITRREADSADRVPFDRPYLVPRKERSGFEILRAGDAAPEYFVEHVIRVLRAEGFDDGEIFGGGLRVYTTLDTRAQQAAWQAVYGTLDRRDDPDGALVALDRHGRVVAMVGGRDWTASKVNLATGREGGGTGRQPGSAFKPFVLAAALSKGISLESPFRSPSLVVIEGADAGADWRVRNDGGAAHGVIDLVAATTKSSNTVFAQLIDVVGPAEVVELAHRMGIDGDLPPVHSVALGSVEVSVLDMAEAYLTLARGGEHVDPIFVTRVEDSRGRVLAAWGPQRQRVLEPVVADAVSWVLSKVISEGTGRSAALAKPAAGKTGTSQRHRDAWFVGYTCEMSAAVWVGYGDGEGESRTLEDVRGMTVTGGSLPAEIWRDFMSQVGAGEEACSFERPAVGGRILNPELVTTTTTEATVETTTTIGATTTLPVSSSTTRADRDTVAGVATTGTTGTSPPQVPTTSSPVQSPAPPTVPPTVVDGPAAGTSW